MHINVSLKGEQEVDIKTNCGIGGKQYNLENV